MGCARDSPRGLGNNRPLPSLARPSLLHRLDREGSKIFVHPLGTRLDVCNGHTRSLSQCHLGKVLGADEETAPGATTPKALGPNKEQRLVS